MDMLKYTVAFLIFVLLVLPGNLFAEFGQRMTVDGYTMHISATKLSSTLIVSGSVKGGEKCQSLKVSMRIEDEDGYVEYVKAIIKNYNRSGRFSIKEKTNGGNRWNIIDVAIRKY